MQYLATAYTSPSVALRHPLTREGQLAARAALRYALRPLPAGLIPLRRSVSGESGLALRAETAARRSLNGQSSGYGSPALRAEAAAR